MMGQHTSLYAMCAFNGELYCGGSFNHAGGIGMQNLAMWDGLHWQSVGDIGGGSSKVYAMSEYEGNLYVGGHFSSCGSSSAGNLGIWNGSQWSTIGSGMNGVVRSLAVFNNELYIAGSFSDAAGSPVNNIAKYSVVTGIQPVDRLFMFLKIFPNPSGDFIAISWKNKKPSVTTLTISDLSGRIVTQQKLGLTAEGMQQQSLRVNNLSEGIYFLTVSLGNEKYSKSFEVMK